MTKFLAEVKEWLRKHWHDRSQDQQRALGPDSGFVMLEYSIIPGDGNRQDFSCRVDVVQVARLVNKSSWVFPCPLNGCDRWAVKLYLPPGGRYFGCRECYDLTYRASQEHYKVTDAGPERPVA